MTWHLYIVPIVIGDANQGAFMGTSFPKYIRALGVSLSMYTYGAQNFCLVAADVTNAQDTSLQSNSDVIRLPDNLDQQIGAALNVVKAKLEAVNIPSGWLTSGTTYRSALRLIAGMFTFMQRFRAVSKIRASFFSGGVTLDTQFNSLSAANRNLLVNTAATFSIDTSGFTGTSTIRQILKAVADQLGQKPIKLQGIAI